MECRIVEKKSNCGVRYYILESRSLIFWGQLNCNGEWAVDKDTVCKHYDIGEARATIKGFKAQEEHKRYKRIIPYTDESEAQHSPKLNKWKLSAVLLGLLQAIEVILEVIK
jgi:hypothetical protein